MTRKIIIGALILFCTNCSTKLNTSENIIQDVFPQLSDSLGVKLLNFKLIPPPLYDENSKFIGIDSFKLTKDKHKRKILIDSIEKAAPKIYITINDSLRVKTSSHLIKDLAFDLKLYDSIFNNSNISFEGQPIRHERINIEKYELVLFDQLVEIYGSHPKVWFGINDRFFGGGIYIENLLLNKEENYGVFELSHVVIPIDGIEYIVVIEKKKKLWSIVEFKNKWQIYQNLIHKN